MTLRPLIAGLPSHAAKHFGDEIAVRIGDSSISFSAVDDQSARLAAGLQALGLKRGDRVVLYLPNGVAWVVAYYALARMGAVVAPANFLITPDEVAFIASDCGAVCAITSPERRAAVEERLAAQGAGVSAILCPGDNPEAPFEVVSAEPIDDPDLSPDALFTIGYTSGTTGRPKGAMLTQSCVFMSTAATATMHLRSRGEVVVSALPLPHVYGNVVMNAAFLVGMTLVSAERFDAGEALALIEKHRATLFEGVPTMYYYMLDHPKLETTDLSALTRCTVGGQTMPLASLRAVEAAFGCPVLELWGMTEVAGPAISHSPYLRGPLGSIGIALPSMEARIVPADGPSSRPAPAGEPGELAVRGPLVMAGYFGKEAATAEVLDADGWLRTGDIAIQDEAGFFTIVDRKKDMIITAGYNIYPAELEAVIATHPAVAISAIGSVVDAAKGELAKAFIVLKPGSQLDTAEIAEYCRARLASYKVPRQFAFVSELPRTSTGKIMRRALRESVDAS